VGFSEGLAHFSDNPLRLQLPSEVPCHLGGGSSASILDVLKGEDSGVGHMSVW